MNDQVPPWPMLLGAVCACTVAPLTAYNPVSTSAILDQLLVLAGWGLLMQAMGGKNMLWRGGPVTYAFGLLALSPWASYYLSGLPIALSMSYSGMIVVTLLIFLVGQGLGNGTQGSDSRQSWFEAICWALLLTGLLCCVVSVIQVFSPDLADGDLIAKTSIVGRAIGNMRQPNHLANFLLWAMVATVYLAERGRLESSSSTWVFLLILFGMVFGVVLSASRAAHVCILLLSIWGWVDCGLKPKNRRALKFLPLFLLICWGLMALWAQQGQQAFQAEARLSEGMGSPKRLLIWRDAWNLLQLNPWVGVGWGEFNFAWTMMVNPNRPTPAFDHTHNLVLQILVELGWPLGVLVLLLLALALMQAAWSIKSSSPADALLRRCALLMVGLILLLSMVEFPLWYAYFLFPTAFIFGLATGGRPQDSRTDSKKLVVPIRYLGALLLALSASALMDYLRIVVIRDEAGLDIPIWENIVEAQQRSVFYPQHADYYAAVMLEPGAESLAFARRAAHLICDEPLLMAWSKALAATGDIDRARFIAQRLKEFNTPQVRDWFEPCSSSAQERRPFQCQLPVSSYTLGELR